jgi:hypothetical protein
MSAVAAGFIKGLWDIASSWVRTKANDSVKKTAVDVAQRVGATLVDGISLADIAKNSRVEPLTIVSSDITNLEYAKDILDSMLSIFAGYYLQAASILSNIQSVRVYKVLGKLDPNRNLGSLIVDNTLGQMSMEDHTQISESYRYSLPTRRMLSLEAKDNSRTTAVGASNDLQSALTNASNLSVGKIFNITITDKGIVNDGSSSGKLNQLEDVVGLDTSKKEKSTASVTIPITIRLLVSIVSNLNINRILTNTVKNDSFVERYHHWRSGRISFIKDLIFCQDLIDEYKRAAITDDSGTLLEIGRRINASKAYAAVTKNPSLAEASNLFVISDAAARELEVKLGGKLSNYTVRQKAFEATYAMIIAVVDREYEQVTFYIRGERAASTLTLKEIKSASKSGDTNILDILKTLQTHAPISF